MKKYLMITGLVLATTVFAQEEKVTFSVKEISPAQFALANGALEGGTQAGNTGRPQKGIIDPTVQGGVQGGFTGIGGGTDPNQPWPTTVNDRIDQAGRVISTARDVVALGEAIYDLVNKGKPSNVTEYAPISVVPRDPNVPRDPSQPLVYLDPFELEGFSMPVEKNFMAKVKDFKGKEAVQFTYKVVYSYGGSYNGKGKYLTNVMIVPGSIKTGYGWEFNASMKPAMIMNHGTKDDPIAGVMLTIKYQMNGMRTAHERNDTIHITGAGQLKNLSSN